MTQTKKPMSEQDRKNRKVAMICGTFFVAMIGAAYATPPLYSLFCQITGLGGTTQRVEQYSSTILDREIDVRFDANVTNGLAWKFAPVQREVKIRIGETVQVAYHAKNYSKEPIAGRATFNVTPPLAGSYFNKVECFCFTDTTLQPGEEMDMPVLFFVDPAIVDDPDLKNIRTITLSYTFFPIDADKPVAGMDVKGSTNGDTTGG